MIRLILSVVLFACSSRAQTLVTGVVEDSSGAAVPKATITLTTGTGGSRTGTTDGGGKFAFDAVASGNYTVRAEAKEMEPATMKLAVAAEPLSLKLKLKVKSKGEEVTVTASKGKLEEESVTSDRNADRLNFEDETLDGLPSPGGDALSVVARFLSPSAQGSEGVSMEVDGVEASAAGLPASSIRRIRVNRNPYSAQYRRPGKARIQVYGEEGSYRRYRGSIGYAARNSVFDARNAFALTRPDLDRGLFDINMGGPIQRQKSAFYVNLEHYRNNEYGVVNARTPDGPFVANVPTPERRLRFLGRYETRTEMHTIVANYNYQGQSEDNRGVGGLRLPEQGVPDELTAHRAQFSDRALLFNRVLNDFGVVMQHEDAGRGFATTDPTIKVQGAFTGGAPQTFRFRRERYVRFRDKASVSLGRHNVRFGVEARPASFDSRDRSNFGGTYEFADLASYAAARPILYRVNQGSPEVTFGQHETSGFIQDETTLARGLSVMVGLRYGWQSDVEDVNNFAPRIGFAWSPLKNTVIRGGAGVFYERVTEDVAQRRLLWDGNRIRESVFLNPSFPSPFSGPALLPPASIVIRATDMVAPRLTQASLGIEQELWKRTTLAVEYQHMRGVHLLRSRNVNAPTDPFGPRPDSSYFNINQVESSASMSNRGLSVTLRGSVKKWLTGMAQYTHSRTEDDTTGAFSFPANQYDLRPEWGRSDYDQRHRFNAFSMADLPAGMRIGTFVTVASGMPFNITTGRDNNGDSIVNDRPAFSARNSGFGPGQVTVDLRFTKTFRVPRLINSSSKSQNLEVNIDAFNLFNHTNPESYIGVMTSPFFGRANAALAARTLQFSVRYRY